MIIQSAWQLSFGFLDSKPVVVEPSAALVSSDAGLLPFRQLDERLGLTRQFAEALTDRRRGAFIDHTFLEMARARIYGILAGYAVGWHWLPVSQCWGLGGSRATRSTPCRRNTG